MRTRARVLAIVVIFLVSACQGASATPAGSPSAPPSAPASASPSPEPSPSPSAAAIDQLLYADTYHPSAGTPGGKIILAEWQGASQLNPWYSNSFSSAEVFAATMRTLMRVTSDGHWQPDLALDPITFEKSVTHDAGGAGFTVHVTLKPNLRWSDGEPMTLQDLKSTWQWVDDPAQNGITPAGMDEIDRIDVAPDGLSAEVHFKEAFGGWLGTLGGDYILPGHYMKGIPVKDAAKTSYPLSAAIARSPTIGPYKYVTASPDSIELARDPGWAGPASACSGRACLDSVTFQYYPNNKAGEIAAFLGGEADVALSLVQTDFDAIKGVDPSVGTAILQPGWQYEHLDFNEAGLGPGRGHPALKDPIVRRAIERAIDRTALWKTIFPGSPEPPSGACVNAAPTNYWQLPDATCPTFDPAAANTALDAAGYRDTDGDGIRNMPNGGPDLSFLNCTIASSSFRQTAAQFLKRSLTAIGIDLALESVDANTVLFAGWSDVAANTKCNLAHGNYDTAEFAYILSFDLFGDYYYSYDSTQIPTDANKGNGYNDLRFADPQMDAALDRLRTAVDPKDQVAAVYDVQRVYVEDVPEVALYYRNEARGVSAALRNFLKNPSTSSDMWNIEDWWRTP